MYECLPLSHDSKKVKGLNPPGARSFSVFCTPSSILPSWMEGTTFKETVLKVHIFFFLKNPTLTNTAVTSRSSQGFWGRFFVFVFCFWVFFQGCCHWRAGDLVGFAIHNMKIKHKICEVSRWGSWVSSPKPASPVTVLTAITKNYRWMDSVDVQDVGYCVTERLCNRL